MVSEEFADRHTDTHIQTPYQYYNIDGLYHIDVNWTRPNMKEELYKIKIIVYFPTSYNIKVHIYEKIHFTVRINVINLRKCYKLLDVTNVLCHT